VHPISRAGEQEDPTYDRTKEKKTLTNYSSKRLNPTPEKHHSAHLIP